MNWFAPDYDNPPGSPARPRFAYRPRGDEQAPAVSIVTPFHNTGEVFRETVESVLGQSLQTWEWWIVNDGSADAASLRVLDACREVDPRIRVIDLPRNCGPGAARNVGIHRAQAALLFFLDADDLLEPTALEKLAWCLYSYPEWGFCKGHTAWFGAETAWSQHGFESGARFLEWNLATISAMVRREVAVAAGGFDESLTDGLEDWDFWLRCASQGQWGRTVREPLDWYRRRGQHSDRWSAWTPVGESQMRRQLKARYPELYAGRFPQVSPTPRQPFSALPDRLPFLNPLHRPAPRLLLIAPWMAMGGADKFNLDLLGQAILHGYEVSVATTLPDHYDWYRQFARLTPDLFVLPNFLRREDYARFLRYLVLSRQTDVVLLSNSELAYRCLPYLRPRCPGTAFIDFCHMEEEDWNSGGHPRRAVAYQDLLDLNIVSSEHLKRWMVSHGADPAQIEVCTTNVDTQALHPDPEARARVRVRLGVGPHTPLVLYAGRLCEQKQPQVLALVLQELKRRSLDLVCLVAGEGEDRPWLARFVRRHRLSRQVRLLGAVPNERMRELLAASDLFFLPSQMEGVSLAIYEAMATGVVPVGADVGGQSELVTPECGILVRRGSQAEEVAAYADALEGLLRSPERRAAMAQSARSRVQTHFRLEQMGDRMAALLAQAAQAASAGQKAGLPSRLGAEHALLALEHEHLLRSSGPLWKYQPVEASRRRLEGLPDRWQARFMAARWRARRHLERAYRASDALRTRARPVKDAIWIAGHPVKQALWRAARRLKDAACIAGHRLKVRLLRREGAQ